MATALESSQNLRSDSFGLNPAFVAILFLWWGSSYQVLLLLVPVSVFMFFVATKIFDKGVDDYYKSSLASRRAQIIDGWKDLTEEEKSKKLKELNNDDFGID